MFRKLIYSMLLAAVATAADLEWMQNLDAAARKARAENKLLLVEFTGSDWCRFCVLQKKKVLQSPLFTEWAQKHFIAVAVDVPHDVSRVGGERQKRINSRHCEEFNVKSFPTLKVMTPDLVVAGGYSGAQSKPQAAIDALEKSFKEAARINHAMKLQGAPRTQALLRIYQEQPEAARKGNFHLLRLVAESDPGNTTSLVPGFRQEQQMRLLLSGIAAADSHEERLDCIDQALLSAMPANEIPMRRMKGRLISEQALHLAREAKTQEELAHARILMETCLPCAGSPAEQRHLEQFIQSYFASLESRLPKAAEE